MKSPSPFARPPQLRPPPFSRSSSPAERAKLPGVLREVAEETASVPARRGGGCRLEDQGQRPPHFPGYAGPGGKGNRGHPDFPRLRAAPGPRGQDAAKRDTPQQVRPREARAGRGRWEAAARGCGTLGSERVRNRFGRVPIGWRDCWLSGLAGRAERRFGNGGSGADAAYGGSAGCQFRRSFSRRGPAVTELGRRVAAGSNGQGRH